jgi:hypothetical protein
VFQNPKLVYLGPLHTQDWEPVTNTLQALSLVEKVEPIQVCFTLRLGDQRTKWTQYGCKVCMDSYVASNGSRFMVTWTILKNCLLEVSLTQNRETVALQTLRTHCFILFYHVWGPASIEIHRNNIWWKARSHMASHCTRGSVTALHDCGGALGWPLHTLFWALTMSWSQLLARDP